MAPSVLHLQSPSHRHISLPATASALTEQETAAQVLGTTKPPMRSSNQTCLIS